MIVRWNGHFCAATRACQYSWIIATRRICRWCFRCGILFQFNSSGAILRQDRGQRKRETGLESAAYRIAPCYVVLSD